MISRAEIYFGFHVDKGWMCVQVFFIRQGKLIERDVSLFPFPGSGRRVYHIFRSILCKVRTYKTKRNLCSTNTGSRWLQNFGNESISFHKEEQRKI